MPVNTMITTRIARIQSIARHAAIAAGMRDKAAIERLADSIVCGVLDFHPVSTLIAATTGSSERKILEDMFKLEKPEALSPLEYSARTLELWQSLKPGDLNGHDSDDYRTCSLCRTLRDALAQS